MTEPDDTGPEGGRAVAGRLVYDTSFATVDEATFNELVALMRDGAPRKPPTPEAVWRRAYHEAMFSRRLVGVQHDLFGAKPTTHMHKAKPVPVSDWKPEPVEEKLARIASDRNATFGIGRPALSEDEKAAVIRGAANWLRIGQRVRLVGSFASYDGRAERRVGRKGVIWRLCSPVFADHTYVYLDPVGAERAEKIAQVELRDVEPIEDGLLVPVPFPA
ncbi:conserved hypothetical protein [Sphingomonas aurantiaca]|uniref:Uncharacterized protein n=1 Tax=Sphingomonas aurantiaca TaxID=185949 RepID=A0A5E8AKF0_9SPHN|nr:hypothetical protein [Sphingomonas aurantiaca]VVT31641.1 conserved hypothetical protein [Sphingomonas aurantiaca]